MEKKVEFYRWIKIAGFAAFIPLVLAAGPVGGYFIGDYLEKSYYPHLRLALVFTALGLVCGVYEAIRIIRMMVSLEKKSNPKG